MKAHQYALQIENLYRKVRPDQKYYASIFELNPAEEFDLLLNYLYAAGYMSTSDCSKLINKMAFTHQSLREYIQIPGNEEKIIELIHQLTEIISSVSD